MSQIARRRRTLDIWPGFVDALSALLLVVIFVLLVFTLGHYSLSNALQGRERALERLDAEVVRLANLLSLEEAESVAMQKTMGELAASLKVVEVERDTTAAQLTDSRGLLQASRDELKTATALQARLEADVAGLRTLRGELAGEVAQLARSLQESRAETVDQTELAVRTQAQLELLNRQVAALREQLVQVSSALELSLHKTAAQEAQIADLGRKLNRELASKVQQLARYRSDFFGRLREALGNHPDIRVVGDRFVFQSELLFESASAELGDAGRKQVQSLARTLRDVASEIPPDIDWVLRIDGHTDRRSIRTEQFPSNWELSTARALAIVKYAIELGIPPGRLAATGFGEFHPLDSGQGPDAYAKNRRIEVKLTSR